MTQQEWLLINLLILFGAFGPIIYLLQKTSQLTRHLKYWQKHALTLEKDLQRLEAKFDRHYHVSQDEKIIMPFKDVK